jgi:hypothetical protein
VLALLLLAGCEAVAGTRDLPPAGDADEQRTATLPSTVAHLDPTRVLCRQTPPSLAYPGAPVRDGNFAAGPGRGYPIGSIAAARPLRRRR